jgi:malic enzyme
LGVAELLVRALQKRGLSEAAAVSRIWMVDSKGLITADRPNLTPQKAAFAQDPSRLKRKTAGIQQQRRRQQ